MNWSKFKLKKICTVYQVKDSYHFNDKHNADSYLNTIQTILDYYDFSQGRELSSFEITSQYFKTTVYRRNHSDNQIDCQIDFHTTTLTITVNG